MSTPISSSDKLSTTDGTPLSVEESTRYCSFLVALGMLPWNVLIYPLQLIRCVNIFMHLVVCIGQSLNASFVCSREPCLKVYTCDVLWPLLTSYLHSPMQTRLENLMIGDQPGVMPSSMVVILFLGVVGSRILYHVLVQSLNTKNLLILLWSLYGYKLFLVNLEYIKGLYVCYGVTILEQRMFILIQSFMLLQNTSKGVFILFENRLLISCFKSIHLIQGPMGWYLYDHYVCSSVAITISTFIARLRLREGDKLHNCTRWL
jgi:hypothetical protein